MQNKIWCLITLFILVSIPVQAQTGVVKMLKAGDSWVILELAVPPVMVDETEEAGIVYQRLSMAGFGRTQVIGYPEIPVTGSLVGINDPNNIKLEILNAEFEIQDNYYLYPAPKPVPKETDGTKHLAEKFVLNKSIYSQDSFFPEHIVELAETGYLRQQAVAKLLFYPVQFNPQTHEIKLYRRIRIKLSWPGVAADSLHSIRQPEPYDELLKATVINYDLLSPNVIPQSSHIQASKPANVPPVPGYKISIKENGLYHITRANLETAGGDLSDIDPVTLKIIYLGQEIPIYVAGEEDGMFDIGDYIEFYAQAINTKYTNTNIYWLTYGGENGMRLAELDGSLSGTASIPTQFNTLLHLEEEHTFWGESPYGGDSDLWFWGRIYSPPDANFNDYYDVNFALEGVSSSANCEIMVNLLGKTETSVYPDHHSRIYLNGRLIDDQWWDGQTEFAHQITIPQDYLLNGNNTIRIQSVGDTGSSLDQIYLDWIEVEYVHLYVTDSDTLTLTGQLNGSYQYEITGFSNSDIDLYDISDPENTKRIINTTIEPDTSGYKLIFQQDEGAYARQYMALTADQRKSADNIELDIPSDLSNPANGADYIIITHDNFYDSMQPLADFRSQQGLRVITARLSDVYDEFNYGLSEPQAILNFLKYAYQNWTSPPPTYVLLVGDTTYDYKNNYGFSKNFMPAYLLEAGGLNYAPSDNWYVCVDGDDFLPDMFIGRISVQTAADADAVVNKIISYEQNPAADAWNQNILLVADNDDMGFESVANNIASLLPDDYTASKVYLSSYGSSSQASTDMKSYINNGSLITNYTGHGNKSIWAAEKILQLSDISALSNTDRLTWVLSFDCLDGFFIHPLEDYCLAEEFVRANHQGALAAFSPTAYGYPTEHYWLGSALYDSIFKNKNKVIGMASTAAKIMAYSQYGVSGDYVKTYTLFGDPASVLKVVNHAPVISVPKTWEVSAGKLFSFSISVTDTDADDEVDLSADGLPGGACFDAYSKIFSWTPGYDQTGVYPVSFTATDSWGEHDTEYVTITVSSGNHQPTADDLSVITDKDVSINITLGATDLDGDSLVFYVLTQPSHGSLTGSPPYLSYTPAPGYYGADNFTFKANDGQADSNTATVNISINCTLNTYYIDADGDGYGDNNSVIQDCSLPSGYVTDNTDCNDSLADIHPGAAEVCDGVNNDCDPATADGSDETWLGNACDGADSDLCEEGIYQCVAGIKDCSDVTKDNIELCDGIDNNCDGQVDEGCNLGNISGFVTDSDYTPIFSVRVELIYKGAPVGYTFCDDYGYYEFEGLADGAYIISAAKAGYSSTVEMGNVRQKLPWTKHEYLNLILNATPDQPLAAVSGFVSDINHAPLSNVRVKLVRGKTQVNSTFSDNFGHYEFGSVSDGSYKVIAQKPGYNSDTSAVNLKQSLPWAKQEFINCTLDAR
jgi:hypothetical protein